MVGGVLMHEPGRIRCAAGGTIYTYIHTYTVGNMVGSGNVEAECDETEDAEQRHEEEEWAWDAADEEEIEREWEDEMSRREVEEEEEARTEAFGDG